MENVNKRTNNQLVFHTGETCIMQAPEGSISGEVVLTDCTHKPDNNAGCAVRDPRPTSFGNGFNDAGGGVYITEFTETAIKYVSYRLPKRPLLTSPQHLVLPCSSIVTAERMHDC